MVGEALEIAWLYLAYEKMLGNSDTFDIAKFEHWCLKLTKKQDGSYGTQ